MWLIEDRVFPHAEEARLLATLDGLRLGYTVFSDSDLRSRPVEIAPEDVARGSCWWISQLSAQANWNRENWGTVDEFSYSTYACRFGKLLLNFPFSKITFHEFCWRRLDVLPGSNALFIRPDDGFKSFEGRLVASEDFDQW